MLEYYPDTGGLYLTLTRQVIVDTDEVLPDVLVDYDSKGRIVGIEWVGGVF